MSYILQTGRLTKTIGGKELVKDVDIHVKKGEIYGFLGPNGAGKTTVMKMIMNLWKPTQGEIELFGKALTPQSYEVFRRIGSIIEFPVFYEHMTGYENLQMHCEYMGYYQHGSMEKALEALDLAEAECLSIRSGTLTVQERKEMENHVVMTSKILEKVQFYKGFSMVPKWVGAHHEYMDGSGYPYGLKGDELDLETRLLTVVDIYDALVATDRPYKQPISRQGAIQILKDMAQRGKVDLQLVQWLDEALGEES